MENTPANKTLVALATTLILSSILAGCMTIDEFDDVDTTDHNYPRSTQPTPPPPEPAPKPTPTKNTGSLRGQVINDDFNPINNALVHLRNATGTLKNTTTDNNGNYTINDINPGTYTVAFEAECCAPFIESTRIFADKVTTVSPMLEIWLTSRQPYTTEDQWTGYISCGTAYDAGICNQDPNQDKEHDIQVYRGIHSLVVAMDWEDGINLNDCLVINFGTISFHHNDYSRNSFYQSECQTNPLEFRIDAGIDYGSGNGVYTFDNITDYMPMRFEIRGSGNPGSLDYNLVAQQPFTVYWREYYWEHAPEDASALPEQ